MSHSYGGVEFFSKFRSFAATLDKDCNDLKSRIENDEVSTDSEGRSHLILREILTDVQKFKVEVKDKSAQISNDLAYSEFLTACEQLAEHTKTQIDGLWSHLAKYGYTPPGELPSVSDIYNEDKSDSNSTMDTDDENHGNCQSNDVNMNNIEIEKMSTNDEQPEQQDDDDDMMSTPVKPVTFTPMIQATPQLLSSQTLLPSTPPDQSPLPPQTTTPMIKTKIQPHETIPQYDTPTLSATNTPLVNRNLEKTNGNFDSPLPPMLNTPGLKMLGKHHHSNASALAMLSPDVGSDDFGSPVPPDITCTVLLRPEDLEKPKMPSLDESIVNKHGDIEDKYNSLPSYLQKHFTIDNIKHLLQQIDQYLCDQGCSTLNEEVLKEEFNLGYKTKAFMVILNKLGISNLTLGELSF